MAYAGARAYNGGLEAEPPAGVQGQTGASCKQVMWGAPVPFPSLHLPFLSPSPLLRSPRPYPPFPPPPLPSLPLPPTFPFPALPSLPLPSPSLPSPSLPLVPSLPLPLEVGPLKSS